MRLPALVQLPYQPNASQHASRVTRRRDDVIAAASLSRRRKRPLFFKPRARTGQT